MINQIRINRIIYNAPKAIAFKGYEDYTDGVKSENTSKRLLHQTAFFRNIETLEKTERYITAKFPKGTHIADFGCSIGEEAYSLAMLLSKRNKDKKYKITGYDLSPKVVDRAHSGPFEMLYNSVEGLINSRYEYSVSNRKYLRELFFNCFENVPKILFKNEFKSPDEIISDKKDINKLMELKCYKEIMSGLESFEAGNAYIPKPEFTEGVLDFKIGDINKLSDIIEADGKTGVIIFKNAWYHISGAKSIYAESVLNLQAVEKIIKNAYHALAENGLFVVGNLERDHLYKSQVNKGRSLIQNGIPIYVCDDTKFSQMLKKNGFKPLFYEQIEDLYREGDMSKTCLPSVWKKVTNGLKGQFRTMRPPHL